MTAFSPDCLREAGKVYMAVQRRLRNGERLSGEVYGEELRGWNALPQTRRLLPPYYRLQVCCIFQTQYDGCPLTDDSAPREILCEWGEEIARDGLAANVEIPDDVRMIKLLSRQTRFTLREWERQGHGHATDGLSLLERIYMIHEYLEG